MACSFWIYRSADLEFDEVFADEDEGLEDLVRKRQTLDIQQPSEVAKRRTVSWKPAQPDPGESSKKDADDADDDARKGKN